jgi:acyl-CoA thioester hydrolase
VPAPSLTTRIQTRFADLDPQGHVNNVAYVVFMETARVRFMHEYGGSLRGHVLVARTEVDHRHEIPSSTWEIDVTVQVQSIGRTSVVVSHELFDGDKLVGQGRVVLVAVDENHRPRPVTDEERVLLLGEGAR